jgi:hypothetical protein
VTGLTSVLLQYQGRLTDPSSGNAVADGSYTMTFRLYDVATEGTALWTEGKDVAVQGGVFSTVLGDTVALDQGLFNGQELWLGVKVGTDDEATPRQQLLPVAYAASLIPGAVMQADSTAATLLVANQGSGEALHVGGRMAVEGDLTVGGSLTGGDHTHSGADITSGAVAEPYVDPALARDAELTSAIGAHAGDPGAHHVRYSDGEAWSAALANDGTGSGLDADLLDGLEASAFASADHGHSGADITSGTVAEARIDAAIARDDEVMPTVLANDGTGSGLDADLLDGLEGSAFASISHGHDHGTLSGRTDDDHAQYFHLSQNESVSGRPAFNGGTSGSSSPFYVDSTYRVSNLNADYLDGYHSSSFATSAHNHWGQAWSGISGTGLQLSGGSTGLYGSGSSYGVYGHTTSSTGNGVYGLASSTTGSAYGVYGWSKSTSGRGVYGYASAETGLAYGLYGHSWSTEGRGAYGYALADTGDTNGVRGQADSTSGTGVYGNASATTGDTYGVRGSTESTDGIGVYGTAYASTGNTQGVRGYVYSTDGTAVFGYAGNSSGNRKGVYGSVNGTGYGLYTLDNAYVGGTCVGCTSVMVGLNTSGETLNIGDAVAVGGVGPMLEGHTTPVIEVHRATPGDLSVLGVVYSRGEFYAARELEDDSAAGEFEDDSATIQPAEGEVAPGDYVLVVTSGLAQVRLAPDQKNLTPGSSLAMLEDGSLAAPTGTDANLELTFARIMEAEPDEDGLVWALIDTQ